MQFINRMWIPLLRSVSLGYRDRLDLPRGRCNKRSRTMHKVRAGFWAAAFGERLR
jgi:hypothetical protein